MVYTWVVLAVGFLHNSLPDDAKADAQPYLGRISSEYLDDDLPDDVVADSQPYLGAIRNEYLNDDFSDLPDNVVEDNQLTWAILEVDT